MESSRDISDSAAKSPSDGHIVSRLPPEILVEIFSYSIPPISFRRFPALSRLSSICSWWRSVVLATPAFWARLDMHKPELTAWMAARAQDMPLLLYLDKDIDALEEHPAKSLVARAGQLYVRSSHLRASDAMWICMADGAPDLTVLDVEVPRDIPPRDVAAGATPRLRRLRVSGWGSFMYYGLDKLSGSLTELSLENIIGTHAPTSAELCCALQSLPNLHVLNLCNFGRPDEHAILNPLPDTPSLVLPHLQRLELTDTPPVCLHLLARLSYPPSAHVAVATYNADTDTEPTALPCIAALLQLRLPPDDDVRRFLTLNGHQITLHFAPACVRLKYIDGDLDRLDALIAFLTHLPPALRPVHEVNLHWPPPARSPTTVHLRLAQTRAREPARARKLLFTALLPHVAHVVASDHMAYILCGALGAASAHALALTPPDLCTHTLEFAGASALVREDVVLLRRYLDFLERDRAHRFRRVAFLGCSGLTVDDVSLLDGVVDEVVFSAL